MTYPKTTASGEAFGVPASPHFPSIEQAVLAYWQQDCTFRASIDQRQAGEAGNNEFVFYDGPPFANGLPHYGHLLTGYVKDVVPRYMTMRGRRVERRFGWDCHGLPAELEAMRQLGMTTTDDIHAAGIGAFNESCKTSVLAYTDQWEEYVGRQARWVDFDNDYKTLDLDYMESVIWAFKQLHDKGLAYEGFKVLPYCWNDETPLSNHELRMDDDTYKNRQDPAVTFGVRLETGEYALVWTTTPWTLPSNLGLAVHPELDYVVVESDVLGRPEKFLLAAARLSSYARELAEGDVEALESRVVERLTGADLLGRSYEPPFTYFQGRENAHQVMAGAFVTADDGTGIVHMAPAFGEDDMALCNAHGIEPVQPLDSKAAFTSEVPEYAGVQVFDANPMITTHLKNRTKGGDDVGATSPSVVMLRHETYDHSYPHCWRCRNPLIYKALSSWFVATTALRDRMLELNQKIWWEPEHIRDGIFHKWLENVRDWPISRNRFWGCPIPVWKSDNPEYPRLDVYGSLEELQRDFGVQVTDLHRPAIDELTRPNPDDPTGQSTMRRIPDVLDCWFESGSMSFAQVHYPFENREWFENHFPGDFIVEYIGQTRGWFYTMHVLATALFDCNAFRSVLCHGIVLGNDGQKMSKSLRNYPDVNEVFNRDGADAMRWFLMASPILRGGNLVVTEQGIRDALRSSSLPLWNTWYFFSLYANALGEGGYQARWSTASTDVLDRYLLAKLRELVDSTQVLYDAYDISGVCAAVETFLDVLTNWYVRRSRERFWSTGKGSDDAAKAAFDTLYTTLEVLCRVVAPLLPMTAEEIWRGLTGGRSVHLTDWPCADDLPTNAELVSHMDTVREVCSTISAVRKAEKLRVRQPLAGVTVVVPDAESYATYADLIADEMNLKSVRYVDLDAPEAAEFGVMQQLVVNARAAGPRLGKEVQTVIKASKSGQWSQDDSGQVTAGGIALLPSEYTLETVAGGQASSDRVIRVLPRGGFVAVDTALTPELEREGIARDVIRAIQQGRKEADLDVSDRISVTLVGPQAVWQACMEHQRMIMNETLAQQCGATQDDSIEIPGAVTSAEVGEGLTVRIGITVLGDGEASHTQ